MTTVAIHQPDFLPYPNFFRKLEVCDVFILYDTAQYSKNGYHNRNRIKTPAGAAWITVPVTAPHRQSINKVRIDNSRNWGNTVWQTLRANYARAPHFVDIGPTLRGIIAEQRWPLLVDLNLALFNWARTALGLNAKVVRASDLPSPATDDPTEKLIHLVCEVGGDRYLSGPKGADYLDPNKFREVELEIMSVAELRYPQRWGAFLPNLSVVDALFNCGATDTRDLLSAHHVVRV